MRAQALDLKEGFRVSEWSTTLGGRWGLFIAPTSKEPFGGGGVFHRTSPVSLEANEKLSGHRSQTRQVRWGSLKTGGIASRSWSHTGQVR
jgi:hypothetical protein